MIQKNAVCWLWKVTKKKMGFLLVLTLIQGIAGTFGVCYALLFRSMVDSAVEGNEASLLDAVFLIIGLVLIQLGISAFLYWLNEFVKSDIENLFKKRLADNLLQKRFASVNAVPSGEWMTRMTSDTSVVAGGFTDLLPGLAETVIRLVSALVMIVAMDRWFAVILLPCGTVMFVLSWMFRNVFKQLHKNVQKSDGRLRTYVQEWIASLMIIKAFTGEKQTSEGTVNVMSEHKRARMRRNHVSNAAYTGLEAAMEGMYLVAVIYCVQGIMTGRVSYGTLAAIMQLVGQVQDPFTRLSGFVTRFYTMTASAERLMEVENFEDDCPEPLIETEQIKTYYRDQFQMIKLENVEFTYPVNEDESDSGEKETGIAVLHDLSFTVHKGEYVAFTGHSGCGKSTVLKLLMGLYPLEGGECLLYGSDGSAIPLTPRFRRLFAFVPQGNLLMSGKLRDVVAFACPEQSGNNEKLMRALSISCSDEFLPELEHGLDTLLGEHGAGLSEGQMQRLAIARAIFADSPVLLLDECTSALDEKTEKRLLYNLRSLTDKTVIIVTHRKAVLTICDRVLLFTESGVEES